MEYQIEFKIQEKGIYIIFNLTLQMQTTYEASQETILFALPLPSFLVQFKNNFNSIVIPCLNNIIHDLQSKSPNSSILSLLCLIVILIIFKSLFDNLVKPTIKKSTSNLPVSQPQIDQEIRALGNQIKNLKSSLKKIIQQSTNNSGISEQNKSSVSDIDPNDVSKLIQYYRQTAENFNNLAQYILGSQESIFKQLKNVKKVRGPAEKTSSHGSRQENIADLQQRTKQVAQIQKNIKSQLVQSVQTSGEQEFPNEQAPTQIKPVIMPKMIRPPASQIGVKKRNVPPPPPIAK